MKIVYMGTPEFAVGALTSLLSAGHEIVAVVTQPDKPKGRSGVPVYSPVKIEALKHNLTVYQPIKIKTQEAKDTLRSFGADIFITAAYGQILSQDILDMPPYGCLNIHASLLPKYRGASPIQHVILNGESVSGVTIMQMDAGLDTGDILYQKTIAIAADDTYESLSEKLGKVGAEAICEFLPLLSAKKVTPVKQKEEEHSYYSLIKKEMGRLDFNRSAVELDRQVRGLMPWPGTYTSYQGKTLKVWQCRAKEYEGTEKPGTIVSKDKNSISVACGEGALELLCVQLEGKKKMSVHDFLLGMKVEIGTILG